VTCERSGVNFDRILSAVNEVWEKSRDVLIKQLFLCATTAMQNGECVRLSQSLKRLSLNFVGLLTLQISVALIFTSKCVLGPEGQVLGRVLGDHVLANISGSSRAIMYDYNNLHYIEGEI